VSITARRHLDRLDAAQFFLLGASTRAGVAPREGFAASEKNLSELKEEL